MLTKAERKARFKYLGLGEYNTENVKKFQKMAFPNTFKRVGRDVWIQNG